MNLHEYQAKQLLQKYGLATPSGLVVQSEEAAAAATKELGSGGLVADRGDRKLFCIKASVGRL